MQIISFVSKNRLIYLQIFFLHNFLRCDQIHILIKIKMRTKLQLLVLTTIIVMTAGTNSPTQSTYISGTDCFLYYYYQNSHFLFSYCIINSQQIFTWQGCLSSCCPQMPQGDFYPSSRSIQVCKNYNQKSSLSPTFIFLILLVSVTCLGVIICLVIALYKCMKDSNRIVQQIEPVDIQWEEQLQINKKANHIRWSSKSQKQNKLSFNNDPCPICLQVNPVSQLFCKHRFHAKCIGSWLKKSHCCPCCRQPNIRGIKIFCSQCRWRYFICTRTLLTKSDRTLPQKCERCGDSSPQREGVSHMTMVQVDSFAQLIDFENNGEILEHINFDR